MKVGFSKRSSPRIHQPAGFRLNFMIIGAQKSGTSVLARLLSQHPDICMSQKKELHFFDAAHAGEAPDYDAYHDHFPHFHGEKMVGEATPAYMYVPHVPEALRTYNPNLKLIMILRNPVDRAYSQYNTNRHGRIDPIPLFRIETRPFLEALAKEDARLSGHGGGYGRRSPANRYSYQRRGLYGEQIRNVLRYFPRNQVLILRYDDLVDDYRAVLNQIYRFLEMDHFTVENEIVNAHRYQRSMAPAERACLLNFFASEIDELEQLLGWNLSSWRR